MQHAFVICAYGESPYLEACVRSLIRQTNASQLLMATSTPNDHIRGICNKYSIPLYINTGDTGLAQDWNFAYSLADTELVTLAHQDDLYGKNYVKKVLEAFKIHSKTLILFSDYCEYRNGETVYSNKNLKIKRLMLAPLRFQCLQNSVFVRRRLLSLGNPICCPAVTYVKRNLPETIFQKGMASNSDWQAWEELSRLKGAFVFVPVPLMAHRIHEASTTTSIIGESKRRQEDLDILKRFWPASIASLIEHFYVKSEKSNDV